MKKLWFAAVAAVALLLTATFSTAEAAWAYRTVYQWDPACGHTVAVNQRYWVPDVAPVYVTPAPVVVAAPPVVVAPPVIVEAGHAHWRHDHHDHYWHRGR